MFSSSCLVNKHPFQQLSCSAFFEVFRAKDLFAAKIVVLVVKPFWHRAMTQNQVRGLLNHFNIFLENSEGFQERSVVIVNDTKLKTN